MNLYLSIFIIPFFYYLLSKSYPQLGRNKSVCGFIFLLIALFIGLGDMQGGYDRYVYGAYFDILADDVRNNDYWGTYGNEFGYSLYNWLIAHFTMNRYIYILIATLTMYLLYYWAFVKYLEDYPIAMIVFMGLLYYFTMTYLRQTLAVGFAWQACRYAYERKPLSFFLWTLLAFFFHNSAIIFAIMYFIPLKKFSSGTVIRMMVILFLIGLTPIATWAMNAFGDMANSQGRTSSYAADSTGYNIGYLFVSVFFAYIMVHHSRLIDNDRKSVFFYNMGLMYCAVLLALIRFGQTGRLGWYFMFGLIYTLSLIARRSTRNSNMRIFIIALSFLMYFRVSYYWNSVLSPYKTFFTNGYPCGAKELYEENEYNENYTRDKFIRPAFDFCENVDLKMIVSDYH